MYNFFVENNQIENENVYIMGKDVNHITNVLRMTIGQKIFVCNNEKAESFLAEIIEIEKEIVKCKIIQKNNSTELPVKVTLYQGLPKFDKMEYIIQKSVELGVSKIVPVDMKYCVAKMKDDGKKITRWQAISESAAKQSKRNLIPKVENIISFTKLCNEISKYDCTIIAYEDEKKTSLKQILKENKNCNNIAIIVGPEGGISTDEVKVLSENGAKKATLGNRILRTETAPIAMLSMIAYEYEL